MKSVADSANTTKFKHVRSRSACAKKVPHDVKRATVMKFLKRTVTVINDLISNVVYNGVYGLWIRIVDSHYVL